MEKQIEEFEAIGFGNQMRIPGGQYGAKRIELINFLITSMQKAYEEGKKTKIKDFAIQQLTGVHVSEGRKVEEVCLSMGLTRQEWNEIKNECEWLSEYEVSEIRNYINSLKEEV